VERLLLRPLSYFRNSVRVRLKFYPIIGVEMKRIITNSRALLFIALSFSLAATPVYAKHETPETQVELNPIWDAWEFYFAEPARTIPVFFRESVDDVAEEVVKFAVLYLIFFKSPVKSLQREVRFGVFPIFYAGANLLGDFVDKGIERFQYGFDEKPHQTSSSDASYKHDPVAKVVKDAVEDGVKVGCYVIKFAKGFAPSMIWAQFVLHYDGDNTTASFIAKVLKYYAYFAAATKMFGDANQCTRTSEQYGRWAEAKWRSPWEVLRETLGFKR